VISEFRLFTRNSVAKAKQVVKILDEPADPEGGGGLAEWAMLALQAIRIELGKSYRQTIDLLSEMPDILEETGLTRLPHYTVLRDWFEAIPRSIVRFSANQPRNALATLRLIPPASTVTSPHGTMQIVHTTHVRSLKVTVLVDVKTLYVFDVHCTTTKKHDVKIGPQVAQCNAESLWSLAADRAYDGKPFRNELHEDGVRPLIKHRIYSSLDSPTTLG